MHLGEETVCLDRLILSPLNSFCLQIRLVVNREVERSLGGRNGIKFTSEIIIVMTSLAADLNYVFYNNFHQQQQRIAYVFHILMFPF